MNEKGVLLWAPENLEAFLLLNNLGEQSYSELNQGISGISIISTMWHRMRPWHTGKPGRTLKDS